MIFREETLKNICFLILKQTEETWPHLALSSAQLSCKTAVIVLDINCWRVTLCMQLLHAAPLSRVQLFSSATLEDLLNRTQDSNMSFLLHPIKQQNNTENIQRSTTELLYKTKGDLQGLSSLYYRMLHTATDRCLLSHFYSPGYKGRSTGALYGISNAKPTTRL